MSLRTRGAVVSALVLLGGCSGSDGDGSDRADLNDRDRAACEAFMADLPATLNDEDMNPEDADDPLVRSYGDPAIEVVCGVAPPKGFDETSQCDVANTVGWYAPPEQYAVQSADVTAFAVTYRPVVEIRLPAEYRPNGVAAALAQLAAPVKLHLAKVQDCL